eukprot:12648340-Ditylum_brightwellii.AAC.1
MAWMTDMRYSASSFAASSSGWCSFHTIAFNASLAMPVGPGDFPFAMWRMAAETSGRVGAAA